MAATIEIEGKEYPLKFGNGANRHLGELWGLKGPAHVADKLMKLFTSKEEQGSFEQFDALGNLVIAGIVNAKAEAPDLDDIIDDLTINPSKIEGLIEAYSKSFPAQGNPQPAPKGRKTGKKK